MSFGDFTFRFKGQNVCEFFNVQGQFFSGMSAVINAFPESRKKVMVQYLVRLLRLHTWLFRKLSVLNNTSHQTRHDIGLAVLAGSDCMETVLQMKHNISANTHKLQEHSIYRMVDDNQEFQE